MASTLMSSSAVAATVVVKAQAPAQESSATGAVKVPFVSRKATVSRRMVAVHMGKGLGASLPEGFEVKDKVVVDENHPAEAGSGDVIQKLMAGFKNFKESNFTYVYGCNVTFI